MSQTIPPVSIITRTMGERLFLRRALACVTAAAPVGAEWIIVDDSGDADAAVSDIAEAAAKAGLSMKAVKSGQRHRSKALNAGVAAARGTYLHIFDDDDTIRPGFYRTMMARLEAKPAFGAVAARSEAVAEATDANGHLKETRRRPQFPELQAVTLAMMAVQQWTPPVSLLFRRSAMEATGHFDESLPVCEDYDFLLRFLLIHDIALIDEVLCAVHARAPDSGGSMRNSEATLNHPEVDGAFRNAMLRRSLKDPTDQIGLLLLQGELARGSLKIERAATMLRRKGALGWLRDLLARK